MNLPGSVRQAICVLSWSAPRKRNGGEIGHTHVRWRSSRAENELECIVALLSAWNYPFELVHPSEVTQDTFIRENCLRFTTAILAMPLSELQTKVRVLVEECSRAAGLSLLSAGAHVEGDDCVLFGIAKAGTWLRLRPPSIRVLMSYGEGVDAQPSTVSFTLKGGFAGFRYGALSKLDIRSTTAKMIRLLRGSHMRFRRVAAGSSARPLAETLSGYPLVLSAPCGTATNYYLAMRFEDFLSQYNEAHRIVRTMIEANSGYGMVCADLDGTMALRLDDPGTCLRDHLDDGAIMDEAAWQGLGEALERRGARMSVMYTPRWVDDGNERRGVLWVGNVLVNRREYGQQYASPLVKYMTRRERCVCDHVAEYRGLRALQCRGTVDVQSHGLTHLNPRLTNRALRGHRRSNWRWYAEYHDLHGRKPMPVDDIRASIRTSRTEIAHFFRVNPTVFTPSAHAQSTDTDIHAFGMDLLMFSSEFTSWVKQGLILRNWRIPAVFLYLKTVSRFFVRSGYPFVGVVHDNEITRDGLVRFQELLDRWCDFGVRRIVSLEDLAQLLCSRIEGSVDLPSGEVRIDVTSPEPCAEGAASAAATPALEIRLVLPSLSVSLQGHSEWSIVRRFKGREADADHRVHCNSSPGKPLGDRI